MKNYIEIKMDEDFTKGTLRIESQHLGCVFNIIEGCEIEEIADWVWSEYPVEDSLFYFQKLNYFRGREDMEPLQTMKFEMLSRECECCDFEYYYLKDEELFENIG